MAAYQEGVLQRSILRVFTIIKFERREVSAIYFYAILYGLLQLSLPIGIQSIINFVLAGRVTTSMVILIALVVLGVLFSGVLQVNQMKLNEKIQQTLFTNYSFEFAWRLPRIDAKSVDGYYMPELVNRFFDVVSLQKGLSKVLLDIPVASIQIVFGLLLLSLYNPIFIVFGLLLLLMLYIMLRYTSQQGLQTSIEESNYKYRVAAWLQETARASRSFKFSNNADLAMLKADKNVTGYLKARNEHFKILKLQYWALIIFKTLITLGMLVVGGVLLVKQQINVGQFVAAEIVIIVVLASVEKFIVSLDKVYDILTSVEKLGSVIDKPLEKGGTLALTTQTGVDVKARGLSFGFDENRPVLYDLSFHVKSGQMICVCGPEGAGKSLLLRLLTGSYQNFEGQILINDLPIGNYDISSLRQNTGIYLSQQEVFEGTLWENISMGRDACTFSNVMPLAEKLGLADFIGSLPKGFETPIDPLGRRLSKTVIHKILLLRALSGRPALLLLEDPWEGMDEESRSQVMQVLRELPEATTVLVSTNSEDFKRMADEIIELKPTAAVHKSSNAV